MFHTIKKMTTFFVIFQRHRILCGKLFITLSVG